MDKHHNQKDTYFIAIKIFLQYKEQFFILRNNFGNWDLPLGCIKPGEFEVPLEDVIHRKLSKELRPDI
jgi:hypothetical protein